MAGCCRKTGERARASTKSELGVRASLHQPADQPASKNQQESKDARTQGSRDAGTPCQMRTRTTQTHVSARLSTLPGARIFWQLLRFFRSVESTSCAWGSPRFSTRRIAAIMDSLTQGLGCLSCMRAVMASASQVFDSLATASTAASRTKPSLSRSRAIAANRAWRSPCHATRAITSTAAIRTRQSGSSQHAAIAEMAPWLPLLATQRIALTAACRTLGSPCRMRARTAATARRSSLSATTPSTVWALDLTVSEGSSRQEATAAMTRSSPLFAKGPIACSAASREAGLRRSGSTTSMQVVTLSTACRSPLTASCGRTLAAPLWTVGSRSESRAASADMAHWQPFCRTSGRVAMAISLTLLTGSSKRAWMTEMAAS
mmetsp:Transcript_88992/g.278741  ORF Transcript_88992/g.278741 Transcript_88992/m.278741 type:complete len:375 (-) Transcript_88992:363-1487(-)